MAECPGQPADFGRAVVDFNLGVGTPFTEILQRADGPVYRPRNTAADHVTEAETEKQAGGREAEEEGGTFIKCGLDIIDKQTGRNNPVPVLVRH